MGNMTAHIKRAAKLYAVGLKVAFSTVLSYRLNFVLSAMITLCFNILFPLLTVLMYRWSSFPGWSMWEVLLLQSVFTIAQGINMMFFSGVFWQTNDRIREGSMEIVLLKPTNPLLYMMSSSVQPEGIGILVGGCLLYGCSLHHIESIPPLWFVQSVLFFAGGIAVMWSVTMIMAATSFKWIGNSRIPEIFETILNFGKYPAGIFPTVIQAVVTYAVPIAMIGFYPASALLGRVPASRLLLLIPCALFAAIGMALYNRMIKLYEGVGG